METPNGPQQDKIIEEEAACEAAESDEVVEEDSSEKLEILATQYARLRADFDNFRRRSQQQLEEQSLRGVERLIGKLLPVLDDFERALAAAPQAETSDGFTQGVQMVHRSLLTVLAGEGLSQVESKDLVFDPRCHEAIARDEEASDGELYVVEEYQKGYLFAGRLMRAAKVKVGQCGADEHNDVD